MKFTLEINLGNEAMLTGDDLAAAIINVARRNFLNNGDDVSCRDSGYVMNRNGNRVGEWKVA